MANEVPNAVDLIQDPTFRDWIRVITGYVARESFTESVATPEHNKRLALATDVVVNLNRYLDQFINIVATDPAVCSIGNSTKIGVANGITQGLLINKVQEYWTPLAKVLYPSVV